MTQVILAVSGSCSLPVEGNFLYLKSATGPISVSVLSLTGNRSTYTLQPREQLRFPDGMFSLEILNLHTVQNTAEIISGYAEFLPNHDGQKVVLSGQDVAVQIISDDIGAKADAAATTDAGTFSIVALVKRLLGKLPAALGQTTMAASLPVTLATDQSSLPITAVDIGAKADAAATTDAGTFSLIALFKRLLGKLPAALGQTTMAASLPVTLASNQSALLVDTELPAAAVLADAEANATTPTIGAADLNYNGATWDRVYNNTASSAEASSAKTATGSGTTLTNRNAKGMSAFVNVSAVSGTAPTLVVKLQEQDPVSSIWVDVPGAATATISTVSTTLITIYPGMVEVANSKVSFPLGRVYRLAWTIGGTTPSFTFSIGQQLIN